jgi:hypothetical protein
MDNCSWNYNFVYERGVVLMDVAAIVITGLIVIALFAK